MKLELIASSSLILFLCFQVTKQEQGRQRGACNGKTPLFCMLSEDQRRAAICPLPPALGLGSTVNVPHDGIPSFTKMESVQFSRGVIKIRFLLLASPNCFIWHGDEKRWYLCIM